MFEQQLVREAPFSLSFAENDEARPGASNEPVLAVDNIQGNIAGFKKDHQTMLLLKITDAENFRRWLAEFVPFVATANEVLTFNRLFKSIRMRRGVETQTVQSTWINIAFSFGALRQLAKDAEALQKAAQQFPDYKNKAKKANDVKAESFTDEAFKQGMAKRAVEFLSDPKSEKAEGNPRNWVFGGAKNEADVVIILASDSDSDLDDEVGRIEESIYAGRSINGEHALSGLQIIYKQNGATLPPPLTGHEHFGFLDGVSQPGVRGRISDDPHDVFTLRQNPKNPDQGKPGQDLLWAGEFIFGYPKQIGEPDPENPDELNTKPGPIAEAGPVWAKDGSFFVVRRLRQDVGNFHKVLEETAKLVGLSTEQIGAKIVGRWKSGAPVVRQPDEDEPKLGNDDCANNHFKFNEDGEVITKSDTSSPKHCTDEKFPIAKADEKGLVCPFAAHIRKTYPRDDKGTLHPSIGEDSTQTHRLLRRGIPFGDPFYPPVDPDKRRDSGNRGLLFAAYQTSIVNQFEFVQQSWSNNPDFKDKTDGGKFQSGHDLIIGQSNAGNKRTRTFVMPISEGGTTKLVEIKTENDWVIPTGGGYFFQPSIDALCLLSGRKPSR